MILEIPHEIKDNEEDVKRYVSERYDFFRDGRYAANKAFNLVNSAVYSAKCLGQSGQDIEKIYYSFTHSSQTVSGFSVDRLISLKKRAPITEEIIKDELEKYKSFILSKKKKENPALTKSDLKKIEAEEKRLNKFLDYTEDDIQFEINKKKEYNRYPDDVNDKWMPGYKQPQRVIQRVKAYWESSEGSDVLCGRASLENKKLDGPVILPKDLFYDSNPQNPHFTGLYHSYGDHAEKILTDKIPEVYVELPYKKSEPNMVFRLGFSYKPNSNARVFVYKIFTGEIEVGDCELNFTENKKTHKNTDLTLFLAGDCKIKKHNLDYNKVMGIDLGWNNPVVWAVNYDTYTHGFLGDIELKKKRIAQINKEIKDLSKSIAVHGRGGHGYKRKCEALAKVKHYKRNFNKTFNDRLSAAIVKKCIQLGIGTIKMEDLSNISKKNNGKGVSKEDDEFKNRIMSNWCYFELQQMIEYKAASNGIEVYYVESAMTSQTCAFCGKKGIRGVWDENGNMIDSSKFFCTHTPCESHNINWKNGAIHADRNAAMNIARSEKYVEKRNKGLWRKNAEVA